MSKRSATVALVAMLLTTAPAAALANGPTPKANNSPSPAEIHAALWRAQRSRQLWATVNVCNTRRHPNVIGIRGQMPTLGFSATMEIDVVVDYLSANKPTPVPHGSKVVRVGTATTGTRQGGVNFTFGPHAGELSAQVKFEWRRAGKVLGSVTKSTTGGHPNARFGDPSHHSAASCTIP